MGRNRKFTSESEAVSYLTRNGFELAKEAKLLSAKKTIGIHTMGVADYVKNNFKYMIVY